MQRDRIDELCDRQDDWRLVDVLDENEGASGRLRDASGAKGLDERPKLLEAVKAIEDRRADVLVVAYSDRLTWAPRVRDEVIERVEAAGGEVWTADNGRQSNEDPADEFTQASLTQAARFVRRQAAAKARSAQVEAVAAGTWMGDAAPPGYVKGADRRLTPDPETAPVVAEAFEMRAEGASIEAVRLYLDEHGIVRCYGAVAKLLRSRTVLGELHFGKLAPNLTAHPGIVDRATWERAQRSSAPRGRQAKSERLLARLGVLRCGTCGSRMSVTTSNYRYPAYRCGQAEWCDRRVTIAAETAEEKVIEAVRAALDGTVGSRSARKNVHQARLALQRAQEQLDAGIRTLAGFEDEQAARDHLAELREARDQARDRVETLGADREAEFLFLDQDFDRLSPEDRRRCIRAVLARAVVKPAERGLTPADRIELVFHDGIEVLTGRTPALPSELA